VKIAMVAEHVDPSGGWHHARVTEWSAALARRGHQVTVLARRDHPDQPERFESPEGLQMVYVRAGPPERLSEHEPLQHMGAFAQYLDSQWTAERPDVIHTHCWNSGIATQLVAKHLDLPAVQTFGALGAVERGAHGAQRVDVQERRRLEAVVARSATSVVATCTDDVFQLVRMGLSRTGISVVPCGVDVNVFSPSGPSASRSERRRVASIGRLLPSTGFDVLLRALPRMPDVELVIGGARSSEPDSDAVVDGLRGLAEELGVADRLVIYGAAAREDIPAMIRSADVVAYTPMHDSLGATALEAMACGVPVVAAAAGALVDCVVHDVTGWLVPPNHPAVLANAVNHLMRDDFLRQSMGAAGRDRAKARYTWDRIAADTQRVYDRLVPTGYGRSTPA
jgi:D-inositol-3-phosphate glycosyltransferase